MATKKTEQPIEQEIMEKEPAEQMHDQEQAQQEQAVEYDPWQDMRTVYVPKFSRTEQNTLEVGVNDKTYFIPKEQTIEVPVPIWEVVEGMLRARKAMEDDAKKRSGTREMVVG